MNGPTRRPEHGPPSAGGADAAPGTRLQAFVDGIALWTPRRPSWPAWCEAVQTGAVAAAATAAATPLSRPAPTLLGANERRRAPDSVLVALQVAESAVAASGHDAHTLASVFTSAHGDLPIIDALCRTLAADARLLSPTRFHHSVHNAASGYWAIGAGCHAPSTALSAFDTSFAAGLLEALVWCAVEQQPVLLVAYDTEACGALATVNRSRGLLGVALVLSPQPGAASRWQLAGTLTPHAMPRPALGSAAARELADNAMADALPLFERLAAAQAFDVGLPLGAGLTLGLQLKPWAERALDPGP